MKKQYEKPAMAIERYELTQVIAACELKIGFNNSRCVLKDRDSLKIPGILTLAATNHFTKDGGCAYIPSELTGENGICYHTLTNAAFTS